MLVKELIEELKKCDENLRVDYLADDGIYYEVCQVAIGSDYEEEEEDAVILFW